MLTIRKICILVILACIFSFKTIGAQTNQGFSLFPITGFLYGQSEELVYKSAATNQYRSELLWDLKPLFYFGLGAEFAPVNPFRHRGFSISAHLKFGLPHDTGIIENRDWNNNHNDDFTNYSRHYAFMLASYLADINAGYSWRLNNFMFLRLFGEFSFMYFSWAARDGYYQFPPGSSSVNVYGDVIRYLQTWFIISPGISLGLRISPALSLEGIFSYSPLIFSFNRDDHTLKNVTYWDNLSFGNYFNFGSRIVISPTERFDLILSAFYRRIRGTRGDTQIDNGSFVTLHQNIGGAGYSALDISLALRIRLNFKTN